MGLGEIWAHLIMDGNGYPKPANPTGTRVKWVGFGKEKKPVGLLNGINLDPSGLAGAGTGVPNPHPQTRRPGCDM